MSGTQQTTDQQFQTELAGIQADMAKQTTVVNSVATFITGLNQKLADALAASQAAGATADELSAITTLQTELESNTSALVNATTQNTTAAGETTAPVQPTTTVDPSTVASVTGSSVADASVDDSGSQSAQ